MAEQQSDMRGLQISMEETWNEEVYRKPCHGFVLIQPFGGDDLLIYEYKNNL